MTFSEWTSNIIAALAAGVAIVSAVMSHQAVEVQKQALAAAEAQWQEAGAIFTVDASMLRSSPGTGNVRPAFSPLETAPLSPLVGVYVHFDVINNGRSVGGIQEIGYYASANDRVSFGSSGFECDGEVGVPMHFCYLPQKVDPATAESIRVPWSTIGEDLCNDYLRDGIQFYVKSTQGAIYDATVRRHVARPENCPP